MELVFLGTSGSIPTSTRSLPSIALRLDGKILLFDCAECTQRQMSLAHLSPMKIDSIFITHLHGDHFGHDHSGSHRSTDRDADGVGSNRTDRR